MRFRALATLSLGVAVAALVTACRDWDRYDPRLHAGTGGESGHGTGGSSTMGGGGSAGSTNTSGGGGSAPDCTGDGFECLANGSARECVKSAWVDLGPCPLGCDEANGACYVPSNAPAAKLESTGSKLLLVGGADTVFDTGTGAITRGGTVVRAAGTGLDAGSGIGFFVSTQSANEPGLGVFSIGGLEVPADAVLRGSGENALVLIVTKDVTIDGLVTVAATNQAAGPGGSKGGNPGMDGVGACGGHTGSGTAGEHGCASGSGGAGFLAKGGVGGASTCMSPDNHAGGVGGSTCGKPELVPLIGGSGGAGGALITNLSSMPGPGGGGGGALQISSSTAINVNPTGRINAAGGGGGKTVTGGGAGGGAGGAILLEAPTVTVATGAILAANGGGGGGGDCT